LEQSVNRIAERLFWTALCLALGGLMPALFAPVFAQEATHGVPQDWSHRHLLYTNPDTLREAAGKGALAFQQWKDKYRDPRFALQVARKTRFVEATGQSPFSGAQLHWANRFNRNPPPSGQAVHRDWSNPLGGISGVGKAGVFPAKYNLDPYAAPSCANDFVVFTTTSAGATAVPTTASQTGNFTSRPNTGQTVTIGGTLVLTAGASNSGTTFARSFNTTTQASNLATVINFAGNGSSVGVSATSAGAVVTVTATTAGTGGNSITLAENMTVFSWGGTTLAGGSDGTGQPTIVAFNNMYSSCGGSVPATFWSYNTGSGAFTETSPVLSYYGDQVAFIQRTGSIASLVLLKWSSASPGTVGAPTAPTSVTLANYRTCTAPCMTVNPLNGNPNNTNSSPFYDYLTDTLYVGDSSGKLHKFTDVFGEKFGVPTAGAPAPIEVVSASGNIWPAVVSTTALTSPVYDNVTGEIFVGSTRTAAVAGTGALHAVNKTIGSGTGGITTSAVLFVNTMTGTFDSPIVDSTAGKVYVFVGDDAANAGHGAIYQYAAGTSLATQTPNKAILGSGATTTTLYSGSFDDTYYSGAGNTGFLYVCGANASGNALNLYMIPMSVTFGTKVTLGPNLTSAAAECSPITEILNTNDYLFLSVNASGNDPGCTGACVYMFQLPLPANFDTTSTSSTANATARYMSVSTSAALNTTESAVATTLTAAETFTGMTITMGAVPGGTRTITFTLMKNGVAQAYNCAITAAITTCNNATSISYAANDTISVRVQRTAGTLSVATTFRVQLAAGAAGAGLAAAGGTGGIIIDNISSATGASQIYYSTLTSPGNAIQASQAGLQ
jgi:hypothetical protein